MQLVIISDHHVGLKQAIGAVFIGASWQPCRVHFMTNVLARVPKAYKHVVSTMRRAASPLRHVSTLERLFSLSG